ncbi:MAG: 4Fe-4S binding protein [Candidatus Omnitrophica bacterium]|nr:4Fe-4S binding protein [Candidatus Omnitrophota bacterium]
MKKFVIFRRISQGFFLSLFICMLWPITYQLTGALRPDMLFKLDPLLMVMTAISERKVPSGMVAFVGMLCMTFALGRFFCGWVCPLGTSIDIASSLSRKRWILSDRANRILIKPKFLLLAALFVAAAAGWQIAWAFDPMVITSRFISLNLIPAATAAINSILFILRDMPLDGVSGLYDSLKPIILGVKVYYSPYAFLVLAYFIMIALTGIFVSRLWCRALCPLGAIYALAGSRAFLSRTVDKCVKCFRCKADCRMGAINKDLAYVKSECILCMDCLYNCPSHGTSFRLGLFRKRIK